MLDYCLYSEYGSSMRPDTVNNLRVLVAALQESGEEFEPPPHLSEFIEEALDCTANALDDRFMELQRLDQLNGLERILEVAIEAQVRVCRNVLGASWAEIGNSLGGMSRQAARQRFDRNSATTRADLLEVQREVLLNELRLEAARINQRLATGEIDEAEAKNLTGALGLNYLTRLTDLQSERDALPAPTTRRPKPAEALP